MQSVMAYNYTGIIATVLQLRVYDMYVASNKNNWYILNNENFKAKNWLELSGAHAPCALQLAS